MLSAVWDDGDDAHGHPPLADRGCYYRCKAQRLLSPHALILISLAAPQAPTASTDPQHRHPCRRFLVACPLLQLLCSSSGSSSSSLLVHARPLSSLLLLLTSPSPSPRSPHGLGPHSAPSLTLLLLPPDATACLPTLVPASCVVRHATSCCGVLLHRTTHHAPRTTHPAACSCLRCLPPLLASAACLRCLPPLLASAAVLPCLTCTSIQKQTP
jgi:hypothetical protein